MITLQLLTIVYEIVALDMCAYLDADSPKVIQIDVSRDKKDWTFVAAVETTRRWGCGHRMPCRPHPDTLEVNVAPTPAGSGNHRWKLPPCALKHPQFVRICIAQTFSGRPPSLHSVGLLRRVGRPRSCSLPALGREVMTEKNPLLTSANRAATEDEGDEGDGLGPLLKLTYPVHKRRRGGSV